VAQSAQFSYLGTPPHFGGVKDPDSTILVADAAINTPGNTAGDGNNGWYWFSGWPASQNGVVVCRHVKQCNVLWVDGHASGVLSETGTWNGLYKAQGFGTIPNPTVPGWSGGASAMSTAYPWGFAREP